MSETQLKALMFCLRFISHDGDVPSSKRAEDFLSDLKFEQDLEDIAEAAEEFEEDAPREAEAVPDTEPEPDGGE